MNELPKQRLFDVLNEGHFVATFSGHSRQKRFDGVHIIRAVLKTLTHDGAPQLQLNTFTQTQHFTTNRAHTRADLDELLEQIVTQNFMQAHIQKEEVDHYFRLTAHGLSAKKTPPSKKDWTDTQQHDSQKRYLLEPSNAADLFSVLGMSSANGTIIPSMQAKYRQVNHFLSIAATLDVMQRDTIRIVDCGCGKAYLSLALAFYLQRLCNKHVELVGIDSNASVIASCQQSAQRLGLESCEFVCSRIEDYTRDADVDVVIALHACDTATDDALALALKFHAAAILAAPCCHHYVNDKLKSSLAPEYVAPLLRDGISRERISDLLTDTMRRDILRYSGYAAELIEFVAQEHTMKNIMIKAEQRPQTQSQRDAIHRSLLATRDQWHVAPKLAEIIDL